MSTTPITSAEAKAKSAAENAAQIERRRRKRAKISAQVHVRAIDSPEPFEEVCKSIDVSRDGLLFTAARGGYWKGQVLDIVFPYSSAAAAFNSAQRAEVVRVTEQGAGQYGIAVQFSASKPAEKNESKPAAKGDPFAAEDPSVCGAGGRIGSAHRGRHAQYSGAGWLHRNRRAHGAGSAGSSAHHRSGLLHRGSRRHGHERPRSLPDHQA